MPLSREEHGKARAGRISSSVAKLLITGTQKSWERLARHLDDPDPFYQSTSGPMAEGVKNEGKIAAKFYFNRCQQIGEVDNPTVVYHHDQDHPFRDLIIASPDRVIDGIPLECKWATKPERWAKLTEPMHIGYLPTEHRDQVEWQMWVMGVHRAWFAVGAHRNYLDVLYEREDLSHIDRALEVFMSQYKRSAIRGMRT